MRKTWRLLVVLVATAIVTTMVSGGATASAGVAHGGVVSPEPFARTPQILDGKVLDIAEVGNRIVVAGTFTQVRDVNGNGGTTFDQGYVFAFDPVTGAVDRAFRPVVSGVVNAVAAGPDGTVYLGGSFYTLNGAASRNLVQLSMTTGRITGFRAPALNGAVNDLLPAGGRLFVAGVFDTVGGVRHGGLATLNAASGALDEYMGVDVLENHNYPRGRARSSVGVSKIALSPDGARMVAIGNFRTADLLPRDQVAVLQLGATSAVVDPNWRTTRYEPACSSNSFDYHVRDVDFAPDGSHFVIVTTGAKYAGTLCDTAARFDTASSGQAVQPRWIAETGGDTLFSVAVTDTAIYVGGHHRWMNNGNGTDSAGAGAVPRPGLSALDPANGLPLAWNAARHPRGIGAEALLVTANGLYVGSDTEYTGNREYFRPRLANFPLAGGPDLASTSVPQLPATVVLAGRTSGTGTADVRARAFDGTTASADAAVPGGDTDWSRARGAFFVGDTLYYGYPSGNSYALFERSFDGTTFGPATLIDPYNDPKWSTVASGSTRNGQPVYYRGALPAFYGQLSGVTGMFYSGSRVYYSRTGSQALYYRHFTVDSGVVGTVEFTAATSGFGSVAGMFVSGDQLYFADSSNGELRRIGFVNGAPTGTSVVAATGDWRTRAMFLGPQANSVPTAAFTTDCLGLTCALDASGSTDVDGTVASYSWTFGDGTTATGATVSKTYTSAGTYQIGLTVTDDRGATAVRTTSVTVAPVATDGGIDFRGSAQRTSTAATTTPSLTLPATVRAGDALVLALSANSAAAATTPAGWTLETTQATGPLTTRVYSKVAVAADAGATVTVPLAGMAKVTMQASVYSGTSWIDPVASVTGRAQTGGTSHTTPTATATAGSWVLSVWSDKQASARTWTAPAGVTVRDNRPGAGNGDTATLLADSGAPVPAGPVGGMTGTVPTASGQAATVTVVLAPGDGTTPPVNVAPEAAITSTCSALECSFDGTESTDADGSVASYAWDFGNGRTATGATVEHTYAAAGEYQVRLTVTDDDGATSVATSTVTVAAAPPPAGSGIGLRGSAGTAETASSVQLTVPESVQAGDGLVLVLSTNSTATGAAPAGWTQAGSLTAAGANPTTQVFSRVAAAGDAGSTLTVALSGNAKVTMQLMAYSGTSGSAPIAAITSAAAGAGTSHTTPVATAPAGAWVLSVWSDKQASARQWTPPSAGVTERSNIAGVGNGDIATLVVDSGAPVAAGQVGGLTATVPTASNRATMFTIVLAAGNGTTPPAGNVAPAAAITSTCASLECSFDGSESTDTDGSVVSYAWDFGNGRTATGMETDHTYAAAGEYAVTLTVTDDRGATAVATATVTVAAAPPVGSGIALRGSAGTAETATSVELTAPESVQAGDGLVLVLSVNSAAAATTPEGWTLADTEAVGNITTRVYSKVAATGDAGSTVAVALSGPAKVTLQLMAYSGTAASGPIAAITGATDGAGTSHTTPTGTAPAGAWVLWVWSDKQAGAREWAPPTSGVTERSNIAGVGNGDVATLVADSGGPVAGGPVAGLTATVASPSNLATMFTIVLAPGA